MDLSDHQKCLVLFVFVCVCVCVCVCVAVVFFFFCTDKTHRMSRSREIVTHYGPGSCDMLTA